MSLDRGSIAARALDRLNSPRSGLGLLVERNAFYRRKLEGVSLPLSSLEDLRRIPFTTKTELVDDQAENPPFGTNLTLEASAYTRIHSTSGTSGRKLRVLDTEASWAWFTGCWQEIYRVFGVGPGDRVFAAFGFGPFVGFWAGFEAAHQVGALAIPGGGLSSLQRLDALFECGATVLLATPTYALRLAEEAKTNGIDLAAGPVRTTIHAGEPGASIPGVRAQIERAWGARCWDHAGMSEVGAWGYECPSGDGLHVLESEFIAEVLEIGGETPVQEGETGELVLTNLGRWAAPAIRYRTGDLVGLQSARCGCPGTSLCFPGGVLGRADDMIPIRGVNVYPSAVESILREERAVGEFQVDVFENRRMWEMRVLVELEEPSPSEEIRVRLERELHRRLGIRAEVRAASAGSLPRFELKARRFHVRREGP